jgi:hypothetical protein
MSVNQNVVEAVAEVGSKAYHEIERLRAEVEALRQFVASLFEANDWPEGGDIDGFTFQELCEAHGILILETRTQPCREGCFCADYHGGEEGMRGGVTCYRKPQWVIEAIRKAAPAKEPQR